MMFKFESVDVWKAAVELYRIVVSSTEGLYRRNRGYLADQIRRAALSISANIAAGTGREGARESKQFFNIAKGSVYEVVSLAYVINRERLFSSEEYAAIYSRCDHIARMLSGPIRKR
jgi:four helix bundle protein